MEGKNLGDYLLLRCLGIGALGTAYLAQHRFLKRPFVVKVLDSELAHDAEFVNRFEREAAVLATLEHPNIVKVHNVSEADGHYFLVTDPVMDEKGETTNLYEYCRLKGGRVPEDEVVRIIHQIAAALDYTHEKGLATDPFAHQGLKPTNILISKKKEGINVQISDFGLSKVMGASNYMNRIYKALADKIGQTPETLPKQNLSFLHHYLCLAPEQRWDKSLGSGVKGDTYAFGVVLYYLLTGKYPEGVFDLPSQISPQYKLPWDRIVKQCLVADPAKRPTLLQQLLNELEHHLPESEPEKVTALKPVLKPGEIQRPEYEADPGAIFKLETVVAPYQPAPEEKKRDRSSPHRDDDYSRRRLRTRQQ